MAKDKDQDKDQEKKQKPPQAKKGKDGAPAAKGKGEAEPIRWAYEGVEAPRLKARYETEVVPQLMQQFGYTNLMQVPRVAKVVINMGVGEAIADAKVLDRAAQSLQTITGQKPAVRKSKHAIAAFRTGQRSLRVGDSVGLKVTLRRARMWEFLDRLFNTALPRVRDFRGLPVRAMDGRGNYNIGVREETIFPEINLDRLDTVRGMDIAITTTAQTDEEGLALLRALGCPVRD